MADIVITQLGPLWTRDEVKTHLHVDLDNTDEDDLIDAYMEAAEQQVLQYCNLSLVPFGKQATFKVAAMMVVSSMYENRNGDVAMPVSAANLIHPYRLLRI